VLAEFRSGTSLLRKRQILEHCYESIDLDPGGIAHARTNPLGTLELVGVVPTDGAGRADPPVNTWGDGWLRDCA